MNKNIFSTEPAIHTIALINTTNCRSSAYDVEAHKPGCRDIPRKIDLGDTPWELDVRCQRDAFLEYNTDFIDEADGDESVGYQIGFFPCTGNIPTDLPDED